VPLNQKGESGIKACLVNTHLEEIMQKDGDNRAVNKKT
jgi:hypothetical protein